MLQGSLDDFALDEVLGLLSSSTKTGKLELKGNRGNGILRFNQGRLVQASTSNTANGTDPEDVLFELLRYNEGTFSFSASESEDGAQAQDVTVVLAAAEGRLVEWRTIEAVVPSLRHTVAPVTELPSDEVTISRNEWAALMVMTDGCSVSTVCDELALGEVEGSRQIKGLAERGLVSIAPPRSGPSSIRRSNADSAVGAVNSPPRRRGGDDLNQEPKAGVTSDDRAAVPSIHESAPSGPAVRPSRGLVDGVVVPAVPAPAPSPRPQVSATPESGTGESGTGEETQDTRPTVIKTETVGSDEPGSEDKGTGLLMRYLKSEN